MDGQVDLFSAPPPEPVPQATPAPVTPRSTKYDSYTDPDTPRADRRRFKPGPIPVKEKRDVLFSKKEVDLIALRAAGLTHQEAGELVGYPPDSAANQSQRAVSNAKKKLSKNERLQEYLGLQGATLERVAEVLADAMNATSAVVVRDSEYQVGEDGKSRKVNIARIETVPDHRARLEAAKFTTEIHNALPEKKIVTETRTFESKLSVIAEIRQNPAEGIAMIQAMLEQKRSDIEDAQTT